MFYRLLLWLRKPSNILWLMPTIGGICAVFLALIAGVVNGLLPAQLLPNVDKETIHNLLNVISGSMLTVSTFSLSIMVSAFSSAASSVTPRATQLVMADDNTRLTIASFISAFIYAVIADIALGQDFYGQNGRFVLFVATVSVLLAVIVILIRWVGTLSQLGRLDNTVAKITAEAQHAYRQWLHAPDLGITGQKPAGEAQQFISTKMSGYLTHIDLRQLNALAEENRFHFHLLARPGRMMYLGEALIAVYGDNLPAEIEEKLHEICILQDERSYDHDPRYGLIVLSEVAQRALSPAVNDPGTGIKIIHTLGAILTECPSSEPDDDPVEWPHISIIPAQTDDFIRQPFDPIARDGAGVFEIAARLQKTLAAIARANPYFATACHAQAARAAEYAAQLPLDSDKQAIRALHHDLFATGNDK